MQKIFINDAIKRLSTSKTTLYKHIKTLSIGLQKEGQKTYLTEEQFNLLKTKIKKSVSTSSKDFGTVYTLKKQLEAQKKENKEKSFELEKFKLQNAELKGRNETLDEQNKKIIFQIGATAEKMAQLEIEKTKLIELAEKEKNSGIFKRIFDFLKK